MTTARSQPKRVDHLVVTQTAGSARSKAWSPGGTSPGRATSMLEAVAGRALVERSYVRRSSTAIGGTSSAT